jgi:hydrogenase maturation protease
MDPERVLSAVAALGGELKCLRVVGCEPQEAGSEEEMAVGLSPPVAAAVERAVELVESVVRELEGTASGGAAGRA